MMEKTKVNRGVVSCELDDFERYSQLPGQYVLITLYCI